MKCVECGSEVLETEDRCGHCGARVSPSCPACNGPIAREDSYCGHCGQSLAEGTGSSGDARLPGESKPVSVLFCDLCGYTDLSEQLDPEELREVITQIFGEIAKIVAKYEGHIQKFIGDAALVLFGLPRVHEDDAVRAIRAALDINDVLEVLSATLADTVGRPLIMHAGIGTGRVITDPPDTKAETIMGDTVNLASHLSDLAGAGQVLVSQETYEQTRGFFDFQTVEPTSVNGRQDPLVAHRVVAVRRTPVRAHRLAGLRSRLVGRESELAELMAAAGRLKDGKGAIAAISGEPGAGKSRLVHELRGSLRDDAVQWHEAYCYAYAQNIPYAPLVDLLSRTWHISEDDPPEEVRRKIEDNAGELLGAGRETTAYIGSLFGLDSPEIQEADPEFWRFRLSRAAGSVLRALLRQGPTIFLLEDIHWADPSSQRLLLSILAGARGPALVLCTYRPPYDLLSAVNLSDPGIPCNEIALRPLTADQVEAMVESLLDTSSVSSELNRFVQQKADGNPFYVEQAVNALIDAGTLVQHEDGWRLARRITEFDVPLTISGVITDRVDRLDSKTKRVLQECAVAGRAFPLEILRRASTADGEELEESVGELVALGLLRLRSHGDDVECSFRHALTQEVVYAGLLRRERQLLHERVGEAMEDYHRGRLQELCEVLAFHFKQGQSLEKAARYLMMSGKKSLARYSVDESRAYFEEAFEILRAKPDRTQEENELFIDLIMAWANVFWYRGAFRELEVLLDDHQRLVQSLGDQVRLGRYLGYRGMAAWPRERIADARRYLTRSLELAKEARDGRTIAYSATFLAYACADAGDVEEAEMNARLASDLAFDESRLTVGYVQWVKGEVDGVLVHGAELVRWGRKHSSLRAVCEGTWLTGCGYMNDGDFGRAIGRFEEALHVSIDPFYAQFPQLLLSMMYVLEDRIDEAKPLLETLIEFDRDHGTENVGISAQALMGLCILSGGRHEEGTRMIEAAQKSWLERGSRWRFLLGQMLWGFVLMRNHERCKGPDWHKMAFGRPSMPPDAELPEAADLAKERFTAAAKLADEIGARAMLAKANFGLARLAALEGDSALTKKHLEVSTDLFDRCGSRTHLLQVAELRRSVE